MNVKDAENLIKNTLRKSANSPYIPDELTAAKLANNKPQNHLDTPDDQKLKGICFTLATERYGLNVPVEVINRLEQELEIITQNGYSRAYLLAYEAANKCKQLCAPHIARGAAGSSLAAFILGITHTNPLPEHLYCLACGFADFEVDKYYDGGCGDCEDPLDHSGYDIVKITCPKCGDEDEFGGDGHNIPFEIFVGLNGEKAPCFEIDVPEELCDEINGFLRGLLTEEELKVPESKRCVRVFGNPILSLFKKLQEETDVSEDCISIDGVDFREVFSKGGYKNIPLLEKLPDEIAVGVHPSWFSDIVKLLGLLHGTSDMGKIEEFEPDETVPCIIDDAISHQEDVMQTLMCFGIERERAYHIMEAIDDDSKTQISDDDIDEMTKKGITYEYISDLAIIERLYPKAHDTEYAIKLYKLMWYQQNFPEEYERAINEYRDAIKLMEGESL